MNTILKLIGKYTGVSAIWGYIDGAKAYITGVASILTGAAGLLQEWLAVSGAHNLASLWHFMQGFPKDTNWALILAGWGVIAAAHKAAKITEAITTSAVVPPLVISPVVPPVAKP